MATSFWVESFTGGSKLERQVTREESQMAWEVLIRGHMLQSDLEFIDIPDMELLEELNKSSHPTRHRRASSLRYLLTN